MAIGGDQIRGHLEMLVLAVLEQDGAHGFEILRRLGERGGGLLRLKEGTLYPALYRLEDAGHIKGEWESRVETRRGPRRRIYSITPAGMKELARRRADWQTFVTTVGRIAEARP